MINIGRLVCNLEWTNIVNYVAYVLRLYKEEMPRSAD